MFKIKRVDWILILMWSAVVVVGTMVGIGLARLLSSVT